MIGTKTCLRVNNNDTGMAVQSQFEHRSRDERIFWEKVKQINIEVKHLFLVCSIAG